MTLPQEWSEGQEYGYGANEPNVAESEFPAVVPVRVVMTENENLPPGFASFMAWAVPQAGSAGALPVQILQRRLHRFKAKFLINPGFGCTSVVFNSKQEQLTANPSSPVGFAVPIINSSSTLGTPGASAAIAAATAGSVALPANANALSGFDISLSTVGTANMVVTVSNVQGGPYTYNIPAGQAQLSVRYNPPITASGIPQIAWTATAAAVGNADIFGVQTFVSGLANEFMPDYDSMQPLYAIAVGGPATVSVIDESYGQVQ